MPSAVSKAILLNLGAFLADNGIRRSVASFAYNFTSASSNVINNMLTMNAGDVHSWSSPTATTSVTLISTSQPLQLDITLANGTSYRTMARKVHLVDDDVRQVVVENTGTSIANLVILQA
jgi:hypothetical protein